MPELKPCPACGGSRLTVRSYMPQNFRLDDKYYVRCKCKTSGPYCDTEAAAIAAWNSLPRRPDYNDVDCAGCPERRRGLLTWTTEPPKVPGWYWCRLSKLNMPRCVEVYGSEGGLRFGSGDSWREPSMSVESEGFEWAGPIAPPVEYP